MGDDREKITLSDRVQIEAGIYAHKTLKEIAEKIGKHPASVSREIRKNSTFVRGEHPHGNDCIYATGCKRKRLCGKADCSRACLHCREKDCRGICGAYSNKPCLQLSRPPYVCNVCLLRRRCKADRAYYISNQAHAAADRRRSDTRSKPHAKGERLEQIDSIVSPLILKGQPLTHIYAEHKRELGVSQRTLYSYIDAGILSIGNIDLRRKVGYRPRRKKKVDSEAFKNKAFRKERGYEDYCRYMKAHPETSVVEMDTVKGVREQGKRLLTMIFCKSNIMLMLLMRDGKADTVVEMFDMLTSFLGAERFFRLFPLILTDNGCEFMHTLEMESTTDGEQRTRIFYCDPQASWQKPHVEKNHEYIRYVLPRGKSLNPYTQGDMTLLMNHVNSTKRTSLNGMAPYELVQDEDMKLLMKSLGLMMIPADEVNLNPRLLKH